eukprot:CAMPEP_0185758866 /NCGR_PEP_ID=MMETSP1174-20130828/17556_1 /TAXON_ID=35687 /ORGANISM="Dictyocha speculum, Strain CCMP1381" /LENGTH=1147 /DNA_ID=CAMNT_0028438929 /DNA_START=372 /DNA_END=3815 /DNA_ORIENTATION=+
MTSLLQILSQVQTIENHYDASTQDSYKVAGFARHELQQVTSAWPKLEQAITSVSTSEVPKLSKLRSDIVNAVSKAHMALAEHMLLFGDHETEAAALEMERGCSMAWNDLKHSTDLPKALAHCMACYSQLSRIYDQIGHREEVDLLEQEVILRMPWLDPIAAFTAAASTRSNSATTSISVSSSSAVSAVATVAAAVAAERVMSSPNTDNSSVASSVFVGSDAVGGLNQDYNISAPYLSVASLSAALMARWRCVMLESKTPIPSHSDPASVSSSSQGVVRLTSSHQRRLTGLQDSAHQRLTAFSIQDRQQTKAQQIVKEAENLRRKMSELVLRFAHYDTTNMDGQESSRGKDAHLKILNALKTLIKRVKSEHEEMSSLTTTKSSGIDEWIKTLAQKDEPLWTIEVVEMVEKALSETGAYTVMVYSQLIIEAEHYLDIMQSVHLDGWDALDFSNEDDNETNPPTPVSSMRRLDSSPWTKTIQGFQTRAQVLQVFKYCRMHVLSGWAAGIYPHSSVQQTTTTTTPRKTSSKESRKANHDRRQSDRVECQERAEHSSTESPAASRVMLLFCIMGGGILCASARSAPYSSKSRNGRRAGLLNGYSSRRDRIVNRHTTRSPIRRVAFLVKRTVVNLVTSMVWNIHRSVNVVVIPCGLFFTNLSHGTVRTLRRKWRKLGPGKNCTIQGIMVALVTGFMACKTKIIRSKKQTSSPKISRGSAGRGGARRKNDSDPRSSTQDKTQKVSQKSYPKEQDESVKRVKEKAPRAIVGMEAVAKKASTSQPAATKSDETKPNRAPHDLQSEPVQASHQSCDGLDEEDSWTLCAGSSRRHHQLPVESAASHVPSTPTSPGTSSRHHKSLTKGPTKHETPMKKSSPVRHKKHSRARATSDTQRPGMTTKHGCHTHLINPLPVRLRPDTWGSNSNGMMIDTPRLSPPPTCASAPIRLSPRNGLLAAGRSSHDAPKGRSTSLPPALDANCKKRNERKIEHSRTTHRPRAGTESPSCIGSHLSSVENLSSTSTESSHEFHGDEKELIHAVRLQIEYYFSAQNLCKDMYLRSRMDPEGFVSLQEVMGFNRIRSSGAAPWIVLKAVEKSDLVEVIIPWSARCRATPDSDAWIPGCRLRAKAEPTRWVLNRNKLESTRCSKTELERSSSI